ncbi:ribosomal RNA small subunit methyltransferase h [Plakobranchus ocellatus]|uniref:Ribosomal RNA small subunit methyltransferase h n=1 Tax=Plakobranchus ocellatus TaxID=259542 RepID=A0AAV4AF44_9GAST|nr:ribosomal RNA small subunit methyltransferase h [Plakobranchus ocellatus]
MRVPIPDVDKGRGDSRNLLEIAVVLNMTEDGFYRLGADQGILKQLHAGQLPWKSYVPVDVDYFGGFYRMPEFHTLPYLSLRLQHAAVIHTCPSPYAVRVNAIHNSPTFTLTANFRPVFESCVSRWRPMQYHRRNSRLHLSSCLCTICDTPIRYSTNSTSPAISSKATAQGDLSPKRANVNFIIRSTFSAQNSMLSNVSSSSPPLPPPPPPALAPVITSSPAATVTSSNPASGTVTIAPALTPTFATATIFLPRNPVSNSTTHTVLSKPVFKTAFTVTNTEKNLIPSKIFNTFTHVRNVEAAPSPLIPPKAPTQNTDPCGEISCRLGSVCRVVISSASNTATAECVDSFRLQPGITDARKAYLV